MDPVKATLSTSMCFAMADPADGPMPGKIFTTPSGKPTFKTEPCNKLEKTHLVIITKYISVKNIICKKSEIMYIFRKISEMLLLAEPIQLEGRVGLTDSSRQAEL